MLLAIMWKEIIYEYLVKKLINLNSNSSSYDRSDIVSKVWNCLINKKGEGGCT